MHVFCSSSLSLFLAASCREVTARGKVTTATVLAKVLNAGLYFRVLSFHPTMYNSLAEAMYRYSGHPAKTTNHLDDSSSGLSSKLSLLLASRSSCRRPADARGDDRATGRADAEKNHTMLCRPDDEGKHSQCQCAAKNERLRMRKSKIPEGCQYVLSNFHRRHASRMKKYAHIVF